MKKLRGVVEHITYGNEETGYRMIKTNSKGFMMRMIGSYHFNYTKYWR